jgi:hypothetical protein
MMEEFSDNELEKRLREAAGNARLQPSEKVWKGVRDELHPGRRRLPYLLAAGVLLFVAAGVYIGSRRTGIAGRAKTYVQMKAAAPAGKTASGSPAGEASGRNAGGGSPASAFPALRAPVTATGTSVAGVLQGAGQNRPTAALTQDFRGPGRLPVLMGIEAGFHGLILASAGPVSGLSVPDIRPDSLRTPAAARVATAAKAKNPKRLHRKAAFGVFFTPGAGYRTLRSGHAPPVPASPRLSLLARPAPSAPVKQREEPDFAWTAGAQLMLPLRGPWLLRSGLSLTRTGYRIRAYGTYPAYVRNNGTVSYAVGNRGGNSYYALGPAGGTAPGPAWVHVRYLTAGIPLMLAAEFGRPGKVSWTFAAGATAAWVLSSNPVIYSPQSKRYFTDTHLVRPFRVSLDLQALVNLPLHGPLQISTGPSFQYQLSSSYKNYPQIKEHPYLIGISAGLQWRK